MMFPSKKSFFPLKASCFITMVFLNSQLKPPTNVVWEVSWRHHVVRIESGLDRCSGKGRPGPSELP